MFIIHYYSWSSQGASRQEISTMCMRALRMVVEVILETVLKELEVGSCDTFIGNLEEKAQKSRMVKHQKRH